MSQALAVDSPTIVIRAREDVLLFPAKVQVQQIETPEGFADACAADIVDAQNAGRIAMVAAGRGTLTNVLAPDREALLRAIFRKSLRHYVDAFYTSAIYEQCEFQLDLFAQVRYDGRPLAPHSHGESFVTMVYYPEHIDCSGLANISAGSQTPYYENQLVLCPPAGTRVEEKFSRHRNMNVGLSPAAGTMIISPGHIAHFVTPAAGKQRRIAVTGLVSTTPRTASPLDFR